MKVINYRILVRKGTKLATFFTTHVSNLIYLDEYTSLKRKKFENMS